DYPDCEVSQIVIHKSSHPQLHFGNPVALGHIRDAFSVEIYIIDFTHSRSTDTLYPPVGYDVSNMLLKQRIDLHGLNNVYVLPNNTAYSVKSIRRGARELCRSRDLAGSGRKKEEKGGLGNVGYTQDNQEHKKEHHDPSTYCVRKFEMIKYSFDAEDEYVAIK
nr:hypothetical protein [Tanacetum cinerariifolium]